MGAWVVGDPGTGPLGHVIVDKRHSGIRWSLEFDDPQEFQSRFGATMYEIGFVTINGWNSHDIYDNIDYT